MKKLLRNLIAALALCWVGFTNAAVVAGNPNGDITMIFIYDYQCHYCHDMYPIVQQLEQQYPDLKVRMMPVAALNMTSLYEAAAAIAASNTNQFWDFTNQVMTQSPMTDTQVTALLNQMGLNTKQFQDTMHSQAVKDQLMQGQAIMNASGHHNVPLFVIYPSVLDASHSIVISGEQSLQTMVSAIQNVQQKMQKAAQQEQQAVLVQQPVSAQS